MDTLADILAAMVAASGPDGLTSVYAKILAPNDNSKNQVYLGKGFGALNILPHGEVRMEHGPQGGAVRARAYATVDLRWIDEAGAHPAPHAKLILYPRFPEVRLSGFLLSCRPAPSGLMGVGVRTPGRVLIFGRTGAGQILARVVHPDHPVATEVAALQAPTIGVFLDLSAQVPGQGDPVAVIRAAIAQVAALGWTPSVKLDTAGLSQPYAARNGGGYTLEAALGIRPNGRAEPDYQGWEVKQFGVRNFVNHAPKSPVTLLTPEPDGGLYHADLPAFMSAHGYPDKNGVPDRVNFGGIYRAGAPAHALTGLRMDIVGFDRPTGRFDPVGEVRLVTVAGVPRATWSFGKLLTHWSTKHARAAYIPSLKRGPPTEYSFSASAQLFVGTDFVLLLNAIYDGTMYLDPALDARTVGGAIIGAIHRRCQFRVRHADLALLYNQEII